MIGLVVLHVAAVLFYLLARQRNLVRADVARRQAAAGRVAAATDNAATRWRALALCAPRCVAGVAAWVVSLG